MRRVLTQVAHAAVKTKGSFFQSLFRRLVGHLGHSRAMWAVVHRLCRLTWKILHQGVRYEERGVLPDPKLVKQRKNKLVRQLRELGYEVQLTSRTEAAATA